jgi:hypothetical protein
MLPGAAAQTRLARKRRIMRAKLIPSAASADGVKKLLQCVVGREPDFLADILDRDHSFEHKIQ